MIMVAFANSLVTMPKHVHLGVSLRMRCIVACDAQRDRFQADIQSPTLDAASHLVGVCGWYNRSAIGSAHVMMHA